MQSIGKLFNYLTDKLFHSNGNLKQKGLALLEEENYEEATKIFQAIIENDSDHERKNFKGLGCVEEVDGYYRKNMKEYIKYVLPECPSAFDCLSLCYLMTYDDQGPIFYKQQLQKNPQSTEIIHGLANFFYNRRQYTDALKLYLEAIKKQTKCSLTYSHAAYLFFTHNRDYPAQTRMEAAKKLSQKAMQLNSQQYYSEFVFAITHFKDSQLKDRLNQLSFKYPKYLRTKMMIESLFQPQYDEVKFLQRCVEAYSDYAEGFFKLGCALFDKQMYPAAVESFKLCLNLDPTAIECQLWIGKTYYKIGHIDNSQHIKKAINHCKTRALALYQIGSFAFDQGIYNQAVSWFDKCINDDKKYYNAYILKGSALKNMKKYDQAIMCLEKSLDMDHRTNLPALVLLAELYSYLSRHDKAIEMYEKGLKEVGEANFSEELYCKMASLYTNMRLFKKAAACMKQAIRNNPEKKHLLQQLGQIYGEEEAYSQAQDLFEFEQIDESDKLNDVEVETVLASMLKEDEMRKTII